jgi:hypothetical protein
MPTRDLVRPWPFAIFLWSFIVVAGLSTAAAFKYKIAFAPEAISAPHTREHFTLLPAIAKKPNGSSCASCHSLGVSVSNRERMNANCAACHQAEGFVATVIPAHREAGMSCTSCHAEHRGEGFGPKRAALEACAKCHNDENKRLYNGKSVHTPHRGTYGYPVVDGLWVWKGMNDEELAQRPEILAFLQKNRVRPNQVQQWRNAQFHGIHLYRVRVVAGIDGVDEGNGVDKVLSCSSCHKSGYMGAIVDRTSPRKTCALCHNAQTFTKAAGSTSGVETPYCASCHVQHVKDVHRGSRLLIAGRKW